MRYIDKAHFLAAYKEILEVIMQLSLIAFDPQNINAALVYNLLRNFSLTSHRINGHNAVRQNQCFQQGWHSADLVGMLIGFHLPEDETRFAGPGADHINGLFSQNAIFRAA